MILRAKPGLQLKWGILMACVVAFFLFMTVPRVAEMPLAANVFIALWLCVMSWGAYVNLRDHFTAPAILDVGRDGVRIFRGTRLSKVPGLESAFLDWRIVEDMGIVKQVPRGRNSVSYFGWSTQMRLSEQPDPDLHRFLGTPEELQSVLPWAEHSLIRFVGIEMLDKPEQAVYDEFYRSWSAWRLSRGLGVGPGHEVAVQDSPDISAVPVVTPSFWEREAGGTRPEGDAPER